MKIITNKITLTSQEKEIDVCLHLNKYSESNGRKYMMELLNHRKIVFNETIIESIFKAEENLEDIKSKGVFRFIDNIFREIYYDLKTKSCISHDIYTNLF
mgnify:CR=1 FL=1